MTIPAFFGRTVSDIPIPQAGVSLAILSFGNLVASLIPMTWRPPLYGICAIAGIVLLTPVIARHLIAFRDDATRSALAADYANPLLAPLAATMPMSMIVFSTYLARIGGIGLRCAQMIWWFGVLCIIPLMAYLAGRFILCGFQLANACPAWLVGFVGILVAAVTSDAVGFAGTGSIIFKAGAVIDVLMLVLISNRIARHGLPRTISPTVTIYSAPISLLVASYYGTTTNPDPLVMLMLVACSQTLFLFVSALLPWMLSAPPSPAYAAFTFPLVITATALHDALLVFTHNGWSIPSWAYYLQFGETALAGGMIVLATKVLLRGTTS